MTEAELREELRQVEAKINNAYWTFTRCARGKPPCLVVPEAYRRRTEIKKALRELHFPPCES
jgi:hypothetical protein